MSLVSIRNNYLIDTPWRSSSFTDFAIDGHPHIWRVNISGNLAHLDDLSTIINAGEKARAKRYLQLRDKNRFIISRAALRIILAGYLNQLPASIEFEIGANKKPFVKNTPVHYNVSHSGDWILIGVANTLIGADVEQVDSAFAYHDIITEYFSPDEINYIAEADNHFRFFLLWTRKEALTKATAKGLDDDLKFIPALNGEYVVAPELIKSTSNWQVNSFELCPGYLATFAVAQTEDTPHFWDIDLSKK
jgi:4'-phosphopantetheinyl transferase